MQESDTRVIVTFDTTHHALWAEEVVLDLGVPLEVVPAPPAAHARCDLALEILSADAQAVTVALETAGIPFALHPGE